MTESIILFTTAGCHLCDEASALLSQYPSVRVNKVDIAIDDALIERYGVLIPVLRAADGRELNWPFDAGQLQRWLADEDS
ncbi:glutaredoxin family protein [uncultured Gilvimarinus sp.]|uniref:glutaredoxin family protein n=1 Tax=uncultured Gilvimarinus sp. TaxID=1689143 RepID=UPI0030ECF82D|tara:strand:- start:1882 stop:2121 length:240 start_codon:yes stop_codon:yes gene_type:complete